MNEWDRLSRQAELYKATLPPGTRILLRHMGDDPHPIEPNTRGTVNFVDSLSTVHCTFDNGRQLGLIPGEDSFRKLSEAELAEEQQAKIEESLSSKIHAARTRSSDKSISNTIPEKVSER